jgi:hypothetical protein
MSQSNPSSRKNERWDIVDALSPVDVTERQVSPRRSQGAYSTLKAVVFVASFAIALPIEVVSRIPPTQTTSDSIAVVHRAPRPRPNSRGRAQRLDELSNVDFSRARSPESLARTFDSYAKSPSEPEQEPDESCFF